MRYSYCIIGLRAFKKIERKQNMAMSMKSIATIAVIAVVAVILVFQINAVRDFVGLSAKE